MRYLPFLWFFYQANQSLDLTQDISEESDSDLSSDSESDSSSQSSQGQAEISQEYLDSLLEKARKNAQAMEKLLQGSQEESAKETEVITLDGETQMWVSTILSKIT